ncbi:MAG: phosphoribosylamine--glycine ligase [Lachnospiraceae bacterium]|nr:phosphoribosylamine--glycine ligase [Lachnospiraceae bacterium]
MIVLVVGSGGREHAIIKKVSESKRAEKIYCVPGNAGIAELAECENIPVMDFERIASYAVSKNADLVIVGPDDPLVGGLVDVLEERGLRAFGPKRAAAVLEGSKAFSKELMKKYNIPTASYESFDDPAKALEYVEKLSEFPVVLKADGLALGKGVLICNDLREAEDGIREIMIDKKFGNAGNKLVIEEFMTGREVSVLSFVDGKTVKPMTSAQDHKRALDGDKGLNTGGMGTFSPSPFYTKEIDEYCRKNIFKPTVDAMAKEGREFKGIIFFGLMLTKDGPKVLEYNARFGDPEAQVVLPRMNNDILDVIDACIDGKLDEIELDFEDNACVCVVLASKGYPVSYEKGYEIKGLDSFKDRKGYYCFHAGTALKDGKLVTNGGRVLGITAIGDDLKKARANAYEATEWVNFDNKYCRSDIGKAIDEIGTEA